MEKRCVAQLNGKNHSTGYLQCTDQLATVYDIKAENDPGYGLAPLAVQIFKGYRGKWRAAIQYGRPVRAYKKEPVIFVVPE